MSRSSVDFPEPERPSSPTTWPGTSFRFTPSSTSKSPPSGFGNDLRTPSTSSRGAVVICGTAFIGNLPSGQAVLALGVVIQRSPQYPVDHDHKQRHHHDTEDDAMEISRGRGLLDVGADTMRFHTGTLPA